jgi:hypothetical protein
MLLSTYHKTLLDFACPWRSHPSAKHAVSNLRTPYANGEEKLHTERVSVSTNRIRKLGDPQRVVNCSVISSELRRWACEIATSAAKTFFWNED